MSGLDGETSAGGLITGGILILLGAVASSGFGRSAAAAPS
jgi:hypothetical protein